MSLSRHNAELGRTRNPMNPAVLSMIHGVRSMPTDGGVGEVMSNWREHVPAPSPPKIPEHIEQESTSPDRYEAITTNYLLVKTDLGKSRPNFTLPGSHGTTIRYAPNSLNNTATDNNNNNNTTTTNNNNTTTTTIRFNKSGPASSVFNATAPSGTTKTSTQQEQPSPLRLDYITMNREAIGRGAVTVGAQIADRNTHAVHRRPSVGRRSQTGVRYCKPTIPDITFGMPSLPSDHVSNLLIQPNRNPPPQLAATAPASTAPPEQLTFGMTRTALLRQKVPEAPPGPLWTMPRFRNVKASTQSFRTDEARDASMTKMIAEKPGLLGTTGHGVIRSAPEC